MKIFLIFLILFCMFNLNIMSQDTDENNFNHIDPMIVHWNEVLFSECSGFDWWQMDIDQKTIIINVVVSTMKVIEYNMKTISSITETEELFEFTGKGLGIDIASTIDRYYRINRENYKYNTKTILLIISVYRQWKEGILSEIEGDEIND